VRSLTAFIFALFAWASFGSAHAGPPYPLRSNLEFDESSPFALVVFEAEPNTVGPPWRLNLLAFDPSARRWTYGLTRGWSRFEDIGPGASGRQFYAGLMRPAGVYAVNAISGQGYWRACFNGGTKAFTLQAGAVNYIGLIDPNPTLTQLATELPPIASGAVFLFDTPRLSYTPATDRANWETDVSAFIAQRFPRVRAPVVAPAPMDATFERGHSSIAGDICEKY
jgi:hypothetical protein